MTEATHTLIAVDLETLLRAQPIEAGKVRSRRIFAGTGATMVRLSLDAGETLKEHIAMTPILVQVLSGHVTFEVGRERIDLATGAIIHLDANLPHAVEALTESHLLLTLFERARSTPGGAKTPKERHPQAVAVAAPVPSMPGLSLPIVLVTSGADSAALDQITAMHAALSGRLAAFTAQLLDAAAGGNKQQLGRARAEFLDWCHGGLSELLDAEGTVFPPTLRPIDAKLADRLEREQASITAAIVAFAEQREPVEIAADAVTLRVRISHHLRSHNDDVLPILAGTAGLSLASLWAEVRALLESDPHASNNVGTAETIPATVPCECGVANDPDLPELDVRNVPHAIRHATVFGALDAIAAGGGLVLVAPHDPLPLLAQIEQRTPGRFAVSYLESGPEAWRLQLAHAPNGTA
jgi:uncharacterized protein (DUF2249 family)/quercetin dioxygenase-like cupin family protein